MSTEEQDKTEEASPNKLSEARKKGQIAKSAELGHLITLGAGMLLLSALWPSISTAFSNTTRNVLRTGLYVSWDERSLFQWLGQVIFNFVQAVSPMIVALMVVIIASSLIINKPVFSTDQIKPDISRLNPVQGFKKLFSIRLLVELIKGLIKIAALFGMMFWIINHLATTRLPQSLSSSGEISRSVVSELSNAGLFTLLLLLPTTLIDIIFTRKEFSKKMRMSKRERKDEFKKLEGNPEIRQKRKKIQRELLKKSNNLARIKEADLVVINPTHIAIALKYDRQLNAAPIIIAAGAGSYAKQIKSRARYYGRPIYSRHKLARQLLKNGHINQVVPQSCYVDVAEVYRKLFASKSRETNV